MNNHQQSPDFFDSGLCCKMRMCLSIGTPSLNNSFPLRPHIVENELDCLLGTAASANKKVFVVSQSLQPVLQIGGGVLYGEIVFDTQTAKAIGCTHFGHKFLFAIAFTSEWVVVVLLEAVQAVFYACAVCGLME